MTGEFQLGTVDIEARGVISSIVLSNMFDILSKDQTWMEGRPAFKKFPPFKDQGGLVEPDDVDWNKVSSSANFGMITGAFAGGPAGVAGQVLFNAGVSAISSRIGGGVGRRCFRSCGRGGYFSGWCFLCI